MGFNVFPTIIVTILFVTIFSSLGGQRLKEICKSDITKLTIKVHDKNHFSQNFKLT